MDKLLLLEDVVLAEVVAGLREQKTTSSVERTIAFAGEIPSSVRAICGVSTANNTLLTVVSGTDEHEALAARKRAIEVLEKEPQPQVREDYSLPRGTAGLERMWGMLFTAGVVLGDDDSQPPTFFRMDILSEAEGLWLLKRALEEWVQEDQTPKVEAFSVDEMERELAEA